MSQPTVLLPVADGSEEIELITLVDVLRRAEVDVTMVSVMPQRQIEGAHQVQLRADALMADVFEEEYDAIVLPGGMPGATHLSDCTALVTMLKEQHSRGEMIAAICASPAVVLAKHGLLDGRRATVYPAFEEGIKEAGASLVQEAVVHDGNIITSRGPATAMEFALYLVQVLVGDAKAAEVRAGLLA